jgi:hypothetical protein
MQQEQQPPRLLLLLLLLLQPRRRPRSLHAPEVVAVGQSSALLS